MLVGAHYDTWFHGYWDNAVGVASILAMARTLLDHGYQPEHTLLFVATDAEEFGAPDTHFDWLIGCHSMLGAHPEWHGRISAAFN
ncbi:MAG: M28 family peptidase, partial [Anaerolineae bacterium]